MLYHTVVALFVLISTFYSCCCKPHQQQQHEQHHQLTTRTRRESDIRRIFTDCRVRSGVELLLKVGDTFNLPNKSHWDSVVLQSTSNRTGKTKIHYKCFYEKNSLWCRFLNIHKKKQMEDAYKLKVINQDNDDVISEYREWYKPQQHLFTCFTNFQISDIQLYKSLPVRNTWIIQWEAMYWLAIFKPVYTVSINNFKIKDNVSNEKCVHGNCKLQISEKFIEKCELNRVCIQAKFYNVKESKETCTEHQSSHCTNEIQQNLKV